MKIGIFGGSFDPVHNGHIILIESAREQLNLDKVIIVPCNKSPYLEKQIITSSHHRYVMLWLAIDSINKSEYYSINDYELSSKEPSYTINTLKYLKNIYRNDILYLILGSDSLSRLNEWYKIEEFKEYVEIASVNIDFIMPNIELRSTTIREKIAKQLSIDGMLPEAVRNYIENNDLYRKVKL